MLSRNEKILIVGLGLLGGSYAEALTDAGFEVGAIDIRKEAISYAYDKGIISSGDTVVRKPYIEKFNIIIFALYPKLMIEWIEKYQMYIKPGTLITDVTGIKT